MSKSSCRRPSFEMAFLPAVSHFYQLAPGSRTRTPSMRKERRKAENSHFRRHIDLLFSLIHARDEIWTAGIFCRLFNPKEFRRRILAYDRAAIELRRSILGLQQLIQQKKH